MRRDYFRSGNRLFFFKLKISTIMPNKRKFEPTPTDRTFIGTFGFGQKLLIDGEEKPVHNHWIKVTAKTKSEAQDVMMQYFKANWSMIYFEETFNETVKAHFTDGLLGHVTKDKAPEFEYSIVERY